MGPKINYMIACASHRADFPDYGNGVAGRDILRLHLQQLCITETERLSQITILRALPLCRTGKENADYFWNVSDILPELRCKVEIVDVPDRWFSYSSWIRACQIYKEEFDYYILCEDDFYPASFSFASDLVNTHQDKLPEGGYLNCFTTNHAALCHGIVDSGSFFRGISRYSDPIDSIAPAAQILFGLNFFDFLTDFTDRFRCLTWAGDLTVKELTHDKNINCTYDIFNPIQILGLIGIREKIVIPIGQKTRVVDGFETTVVRNDIIKILR